MTTYSVDVQGLGSWGALSQAVLQACERAGVPGVPANGTMHVVLTIGDEQIAVTASTKFAELSRAKVLRVALSGGQDEAPVTATRSNTTWGAMKSHKRC